jgi:hypothetical protein
MRSDSMAGDKVIILPVVGAEGPVAARRAAYLEQAKAVQAAIVGIENAAPRIVASVLFSDAALQVWLARLREARETLARLAGEGAVS